jgi:protein-S-isoprenylcysteine O-methyltransferase
VVAIAPDQRVVQHGPYRMLRHPGYAGALLALLGVGIMLANWLSVLVLVLVPMFVLSVRISVEEAALAGALGAEYLAYAGRTARLIPGVW